MPIVSSRTKSKINRRKKEKVARRSRTPIILFDAALWGILISILLFVDPEASGSVELFFGILFASLALTLHLIIKNVRRTLLISTATVLFLLLRYADVGNIFNLFLIVGVIVAFELRFSKRY